MADIECETAMAPAALLEAKATTGGAAAASSGLGRDRRYTQRSLTPLKLHETPLCTVAQVLAATAVRIQLELSCSSECNNVASIEKWGDEANVKIRASLEKWGGDARVDIRALLEEWGDKCPAGWSYKASVSIRTHAQGMLKRNTRSPPLRPAEALLELLLIFHSLLAACLQTHSDFCSLELLIRTKRRLSILKLHAAGICNWWSASAPYASHPWPLVAHQLCDNVEEILFAGVLVRGMTILRH